MCETSLAMSIFHTFFGTTNFFRVPQSSAFFDNCYVGDVNPAARWAACSAHYWEVPGLFWREETNRHQMRVQSCGCSSLGWLSCPVHLPQHLSVASLSSGWRGAVLKGWVILHGTPTECSKALTSIMLLPVWRLLPSAFKPLNLN